MEGASLVVELLARGACLTRAKGTEVVGRLGDHIGKKLKDHATSGLATDGDVKEDSGLGSLFGIFFFFSVLVTICLLCFGYLKSHRKGICNWQRWGHPELPIQFAPKLGQQTKG